MPVPGARRRAWSLRDCRTRRHPPGHPSPTRFACRKTQSGGVVGGVGCCVDPPYHVVLAVKVCVSAGRSLAPFGRLRTLTAALRREGIRSRAIPARSRPEFLMSQSSFSFAVSSTEARFTNALLVRDVDGQYRVASADEVLSQAWGMLADRVKPGVTLSSPQDVKDYLRLAIGMLEHEVFCVVFLDAQHRVIELQQMFRGTVTQTSVYPREVVKASSGSSIRSGSDPGAQPPFGRQQSPAAPTSI